MGSYYTLLTALAEDDRIEEADELWKKLFTENLESTPRLFFEKMVSIYYRRDMHENIFEVISDTNFSHPFCYFSFQILLIYEYTFFYNKTSDMHLYSLSLFGLIFSHTNNIAR